MNDTTKPEGGCTCGNLRYRLKSKPLFVHCCHCSWCQRETGSAFAVNALIEADRVMLLKGTPVAVTLPSASGKGQVMHRCPDCGVTLWSNYAGAGPTVNFVRVGTLDPGHDIEPDIHIYTASKQPWIDVPLSKPSAEGFYSPKEFWPEDSLERLRAQKGNTA